MAQADKSRKKLSGGIIFCKVFLCCVLRSLKTKVAGGVIQDKDARAAPISALGWQMQI